MYTPGPDDEGFGLIKAALRDYLVADLSAYGLPSVTQLLPAGASGVIDEGFFDENMQAPAVMFATLGDGQRANVREASLVRFLVYVLDRGRGLYTIERILNRVRQRLNRTELALEFLTFPPEVTLRIEHIEASGSAASASLPAWKAEARAIYLFLTIRGLQSDY